MRIATGEEVETLPVRSAAAELGATLPIAHGSVVPEADSGRHH
jgi:hypothetical protein